ncbi:MAG: GEVED domain-containing protein, partial [Actinomycetia bacterium]|nr:GEVED domain-containing protein [Actinomycetes bacterium]
MNSPSPRTAAANDSLGHRVSSKSSTRRRVASGATALALALAMTGGLSLAGLGNQADAYQVLGGSSTTATNSYVNQPGSTVTASFPSGLRTTLAIAAGNPSTGALVGNTWASYYASGDLTTTTYPEWPMIYYPLVIPDVKTKGGPALAKYLENTFGMSRAGWSAFKDVGTVTLTFSRPVANPIITIGGPGWFRHRDVTTFLDMLTANPKYTFTATTTTGDTVTPTLTATSGAKGVADYYAATGNVYGPAVDKLVQSSDMSGYNGATAGLVAAMGVSGATVALASTLVSSGDGTNVASLVADVQVNTGGEQVTKVTIQTSYQLVELNRTGDVLSNVSTYNLQTVPDIFTSKFNARNAVESSGPSTPASYGYAANSVSSNSGGDFGVSLSSDGLAIGSTVMPYMTTTSSSTLAAPTATNNSSAGYDGVTAAQLNTLGAKANPANIGKQIHLTVPLSNVNAPATLTGYLDFQHAGRFTGTNDEASVQVPAGATSATLTWTVPADVASTQTPVTSWLRLRLQYGATGGTTPVTLSPTGWQDSGETEDYPLLLSAPIPDIAVTKTSSLGSGSGSVGQSFTYTITAQNRTTSDVSGATVTDTVPDGLAIDATHVSPAGSVSGQVITWTDQDFAAAGASGDTLEYTVRVTPTDGGTYTNTADVTTPDGCDDGSGTCSASVTDTIDTPPVALGGTVWNDLNHNGVLDSGEPVLDGVAVTITDPAGDVVAAVTTEPDGTWATSAPASADGYTVTVTKPAGTSFSPAGTGPDPAVNSVVDASGTAPTGPVVYGHPLTALNAGVYASVTGTKSVRPASGSAVKPGDTLTWTLTWTNASTLDAGVAQADDLSLVVDDVTVTMPTASDPAGLTIT